MTFGKDREYMLRKLFGLPTDDVIPITFEDYLNALSEVIEVAKSTGALSVFTYGNISVPGISDLDILIISREKFPTGKLSKKTRWIMSHTPVVIAPEDIETTVQLLNTNNLKLVWGKPIEFPKPSKENLKALSVKYTVWKTISLHKNLTTKNLSARKLMLHLHGLRYSFKEIGVDRPEYFEEVSRIRENWFKMNKRRKLEELLILTYKSFSIIEDFFSFFSRKSADIRKTGNWIWIEGRADIPTPERALPLKGRISEILYYMHIYTARIPGEALDYIESYTAGGWRNLMVKLSSFTRKTRKASIK